MNYIPILVNVSGRRVVIIGGGHAAYKKVKNLLNHERKITVIASEFDPKFSDVEVEMIKLHIDDPMQVDNFLEGDNIVVIATDDSNLNHKLEEVCKRKHLLYNRVDEIKSPFIFPASFESNGVIVSISTLGKGPSLTRYIRDKLQERIGVLPLALQVVERLRNDCGIFDLKIKAEFFQELFGNDEFWKHVASKRDEDAYGLGMILSEKYQGN